MAGQWYAPARYGNFEEYLFAHGHSGDAGSLNIYLAEGSGELHTRLCPAAEEGVASWLGFGESADAAACSGRALTVYPSATRNKALGDDAWHMFGLGLAQA